jgi:cytochrome c oxidase subunit 3
VSHAAAHDHPDNLAHHFDTPKQQFEAGKLGMWMFLATEVLLFGGLFCAYAVWRGNHPDLFKYGSQFLDTKWGAINTAVLITSSLTMAAAVTAAQKSRRGPLIALLSLTLAGALIFLGIKYIEYSHKFQEGWFPGMRFYEKPAHAHTWDPNAGVVVSASFVPDEGGPQEVPPPPLAEAEPTTVALAATGPSGFDASALDAHGHSDHDEEHETHQSHHTHPLQDSERPDNVHMFFNIYFMMTGLHGIHVLVGGIVLGWLLLGAVRGRFHAGYFTPVDLGGLYWHVVDLIWIFLFPLFYLI